MAANQDKIHEEALKVELSITHLSQELKESVGTEKDVGQLNSRINRQLDDLRGKIQVSLRQNGLDLSLALPIAYHDQVQLCINNDLV